MDGAGNNVCSDAHRRSTMMGNASKEPLLQVKISLEVARNPAPVIPKRAGPPA
jgi:hypothetical protein